MIEKVNLERDKKYILAHIEAALNQMIIQQEEYKKIGKYKLCEKFNIKLCADCDETKILSNIEIVMPGIAQVIKG